MVFLVYILKDIVTGEFSAPILAYNLADIKRQFTQKIANSPHKADYQAFVTGSYDTSVGLISAYPSLEYVCGGNDNE